MAELEFTRVTQTSITVRLVGLDLTGQANKGTSKLPRHNTYQISCIGDIRTVSTGSDGNSGTATYSGLSPGTTYDFAGLVNYTDEKGKTSDVYIPDTCTTEEIPPPVRPPNWSWWSDVRAGQPVAFTAAEFQAFYDKIDAFRVYKFGPGNEWPKFIPVSKGTPLSAAIVNEARAAIAPMTLAAMPPTAYAGVTKISADYFNKLENYLNSVT